jgi:multiple sugar transport system ATP-binding protein
VHVDGDAVTVDVGPVTLPVGAPALERYPRVRGCDGRSVVVGIRAEDVHPATVRPELPTLDARVDLVEALGSGVMAYFTIEATAVLTEAQRLHDEVAEGSSGISGTRPNLVAHFPPRVALKIGETIPVAVDTDNLHMFDGETGSAYR